MKKFTVLIILLVLLIGFDFSTPFAQNPDFKAITQNLQDASPESVGISSERLKRVDELLQTYLNKQKISGAVAMIVRKGKIVYRKAVGTSGIGNNQPMKQDDLFRIMSMTKPITSVALMMLYEEGKFLLDDPLYLYIPEFKDPKIIKTYQEQDTTYTTEPSKSQITIRQILTHTSGIMYGFMDSKKWGAILAKAKVPDFANAGKVTIGEKMKILATLPLIHQPGERWTYGLNTDVCGYLVEVLSGMTLSEFCEKRIFQPLGMNETHYFFPESAENRLVHVFSEDKQRRSVKNTDLKQYKLVEYPTKGAKTYFSGGSGLTSTAEDYLKFCQFILNGGVYNNQRLLSRKTIELITTNQIKDLNVGWGGDKFGLGFSIVPPQNTFKKLGSVGRLGWSGAFATTFWIDPEEELIGILMMQIYPFSHGEIYEKFENMVYQSIED